jgi:hypothetical protein
MKQTDDRCAAPLAPQRGVVLLVVLLLSATVSMLAMSLLATTEISVRSMAAGRGLERAELAARSGVEWAAAKIAASGEVAGTVVVPVGRGTSAEVTLAPGADPNVTSRGRADGVRVTVTANVKSRAVPVPYAFASFNGASKLPQPLTVLGKAYFGTFLWPINYPASVAPAVGPALILSGDLDLVTSIPLTAGTVDHSGGGSTRYGVSPLTLPAADTAAFTTMTTGTVPVHHYTNPSQVKNVTLSGVVVIQLDKGSTVELRACTINGTLVVHELSAPTLAATTIAVANDVTIAGGTALTGNLAVLAPDCTINADNASAFDLHGVVYCSRMQNLKNTSVTGMLLTKYDIETTEAATVTRPAGWSPDLPLGLTLPTTIAQRIVWVGRSL